MQSMKDGFLWTHKEIVEEEEMISADCLHRMFKFGVVDEFNDVLYALGGRHTRQHSELTNSPQHLLTYRHTLQYGSKNRDGARTMIDCIYSTGLEFGWLELNDVLYGQASVNRCPF